MRKKDNVLQILNKHKLNYLRAFSDNIFMLLVQYLGTEISISHLRYCLISAGTALGFIFLRGPIILPGIIIGMLIANVMHASIIVALQAATVFTLQTYCIYQVSYVLGNPTLVFNSFSLFFKMLLVIISITLLTTYWLTYFCLGTVSGHNFLNIWFANVNGSIVFAYGLIAWDMFFPDFMSMKKQQLLCYLGLLSIYSFLFLQIPQLYYQHYYLMLLWLSSMSILFVIGHLFGQCGLLLAMMITILLSMFLETSPTNALDHILLCQFLLFLQLILALTYAILRYNQIENLPSTQEL